jgi:hypothetical protein
VTAAEADNLIATLPTPGPLRLQREGDWIVMTGGKTGSHEIDTKASSAERLLIHWKGYVENNGYSLGVGYTTAQLPLSASRERVPVVGQWVSFPSKSAKSGWRRGQVVKVTPKRVLIAYRFNYEREYDRKHGLKFDPSDARTAWRKLTEIKIG